MKKVTHLFKCFKQPWFGCLCAGALLPLGFAPFNYWFITILSLSTLIFLTNNLNPKQAFGSGFAFGFGAFATGVSWVYIALRFFGGAAPALAMLLTLLLIMYLALFPAIASFLQQKFFHASLFTFPCLWVLTEWVRGWFLSGFPWLFVGYSQMPLLGGYAPIGGIYLLSFVTVLIASFIAHLFTNNRKQQFITVIGILLLSLIGYFSQTIQWIKPNHKTITVSILQGNIAKEFKWNPKKSLENIESYVKLTQQNWRSDFIVWPEGTFSLPQTYGDNIIQSLNEQAKKHNATVALGLPYVKENNFYNSLMLIGKTDGVYSKRHLVPFGEYTPLSFLIKPLLSWLQIPMSNYSAGSNEQQLLTVNGIHIAPFICYEIVYPGLVLRDLPTAQLLLTISEDAWYGDSVAVDQHLQMAQLRSLESGRYSIFAVNTGISAFIDDHGKIIDSIPLNKRGVITQTLPAIDGATPWVIIGNWPWLLAMFFVLLVAFYTQKRIALQYEQNSH